MNIGEVTYSIEVNTSGLDKAERKMDEARKSSDQLGDSLDNSSRSAKTAKDRFTGAGAAADKLGKDSKRATDKINAGFNSAKSAVNAFAGVLVSVGIVRGFTKMISVTNEFNASVSELSAITGATGKDLEYYAEQSREIGRSTTLSATQAAAAFKLIASAKPDLLANAEALSAVTKEAVTLAEAARLDLGTAANALGNALNQFGAGAKEANRFINVLAAGSKLGASAIGDTSLALKNVGAVAASVGLSFEETNAAIQALAAGGLKAAEAGTGLRGVLLKLEKSGDSQITPSIVGMSKAIENLREKGLTTVEMMDLFGLESITAANTLIAQSDAVTQLTRDLTGTNIAAEQAATNFDNLAGDTARLKSATEDLMISFGQRFTPVLREMAQATTALLNDYRALVEEGLTPYERAVRGAIQASKEQGMDVLQLHITGVQMELDKLNAELDELRPNLDGNAVAQRQYAIVLEKVEDKTVELELANQAMRDSLAESEQATAASEEAQRELNAEYSNADGHIQTYIEQLAAATEESVAATEQTEKQKIKVGEIIEKLEQEEAQLGMTSRAQAIYTATIEATNAGALPEEIALIVEKTAKLYDAEVAAQTHADAVEQAEKDQQEAMKATEATNLQVQEAMREQWNQTRDKFADFFLDLIDNGSNAFDSLLKSFKQMIKQMVAEWLASGLMKLLGMGGGGPTSAGGFSLFGGGGGLAGLLGIGGNGGGGLLGAVTNAATSVFGGGGAGGLLGALLPTGGNSMIAPSTAMSGLTKGLASLVTSPVAIALAGLGVGKLIHEKTSDPDNYKRVMGGMLTAPTAGAPVEDIFDVQAFASGFKPIGFAEGSQADAMAIIDQFRFVDAAIVDAVSQIAGATIDLSKATLGGFGVEGTGSGTFMGRTQKTTDQQFAEQINSFAQQLADHIHGLDANQKAQLKASESVEELVYTLYSFADQNTESQEQTVTNTAATDNNTASLDTNATATQSNSDIISHLQTTNELLWNKQGDLIDSNGSVIATQTRVADLLENLPTELETAYNAFLNRTQKTITVGATDGQNWGPHQEPITVGATDGQNWGPHQDSTNTQTATEVMNTSVSTAPNTTVDFSRVRQTLSNMTTEEWAANTKASRVARNKLRADFGYNSMTGQWDMSKGGPDVYWNTLKALKGLPVDGSHADGLDRVPRDGYIAELHQGERVLTSAEADAMDSGMGAGAGGGGGGFSLIEIASTILTNSTRVASIIRRWDRDGIPEQRT